MIPYVERGEGTHGLRPQVKRLGERFGARFVPMTTPTSYFELIESLWTGQRDFVLLEEDVLPADAVIDSMARCSERWCCGAFTENAGKLTTTSLGLNRFSARLQREHPEVMARVAEVYPQRYWVYLDLAFIDLVLEKQLRPHVHLPAAQDLHVDETYRPPVFEGQLEPALRRMMESKLMLVTAGFPVGAGATAQRAMTYDKGRRP